MFLFLCELFLALNTPVSANVEDRHILLAQNAPDQHPSVTIRRILFAAEDARAVRFDNLHKLGYTLLKSGRLCQQTVQHVALLVVVLVILWTASDEISEEVILDTFDLQRARDILFVEVNGIPSVRARADVHDELDLMLLQQIEHFLEWVVRVPDREYCQLTHVAVAFHWFYSCVPVDT
jgi:hypothetical protein